MNHLSRSLKVSLLVATALTANLVFSEVCCRADDRWQEHQVITPIPLFEDVDRRAQSANLSTITGLKKLTLDTVHDPVFPLSWSDQPFFQFDGFPGRIERPGPAPIVLSFIFENAGSQDDFRSAKIDWWNAWDGSHDGKEWSPLKLAFPSVIRSDLPAPLVSDVTIEEEELRFCFQYAPLLNPFRPAGTDQKVTLKVDFTESTSPTVDYFRSMSWMPICLDKWIRRDDSMVTAD